MKKTLITLLAITSMAMGDVSESLTLSSPTTASTQAGYCAFDFQLNSDWLTASDSNWQMQADKLNLTSITITPAVTWYRDSTNGAGLAIYQKSTSETKWSYVGRSDWQKGFTVNGSTPLTFSFDSLELLTDTKYTVVIYGHQDSFNKLTSASQLESLTGVQTPSASTPTVAMGLKNLSPTDSNSNFVAYTATGATDGGRSLKVSFTATPEPATATLSLLALAGLAARRRH